MTPAPHVHARVVLQDASTETQRQRAIVSYLRRCVTPWVFHVPNGGLRDPRVAAKLKADGVLPGVPDIGVVLPGGKILWIEVKAPGGRLSEAQIAFRDHIMATGGLWCLAYDIDGVERALASYGIASRGKAA